MRIVTWNACRGQFDKKVPFLDHLVADIAVIQEIARPKTSLDNVLWFGDNPNQGMAVVAKNDYQLTPLPTISEAPPYVIPIQVSGPQTFILFAVCTMGTKPYPYVRGACRAIDLYADLFRDQTVAMIGDFNSNAIWNKSHPKGMNHAALLERLDHHGLFSAYHAHYGEAQGEETRPTYYHQWKQTQPFHIDFCFLPNPWRNALIDVDVGSWIAWQKCSDHRPVLVSLDL